MAAFDHHFMPLSPPPRTEEECKNLTPLGTINADTKIGHILTVRFLGTQRGISVIAVTIPESVANHEDQNRWMRQIMETSLTAIRLTYDPSAEPVYSGHGFASLLRQSDDPEPEYAVTISYVNNSDWSIDINNVIGSYQQIHESLRSPVATLLAEGQIPSMPPHYRVLSLIRAAELLWPDERIFNSILDTRNAEFLALNLSKRHFRSALAEIRTRCAHGRSRGRSNPHPYFGIGYNEQLGPLIKLLSSIIVQGLSDAGVQIVERYGSVS